MPYIGVQGGKPAAKVSNNDGLFTAVLDTNFTPASYQWFKDGVAINGATQSTYNSNSVAGVYKCVVTGSYSTKDSIITVVAEYLLTENGQQLLTENGQPMEMENV